MTTKKLQQLMEVLEALETLRNISPNTYASIGLGVRHLELKTSIQKWQEQQKPPNPR